MKAIETNTLNGGIQKIFKFRNGYFASVVRHQFSYGGRIGKWELAVMDSKRTIVYDTPITNDVLGWLSESAVRKTLCAIAKLPRRKRN